MEIKSLGQISATFYEQLLHAQIPKAQKKTDSMTVFFALLESAHIKAVRKMLVKSTPGQISAKRFGLKSGGGD